jgi:hypothetical protein
MNDNQNKQQNQNTNAAKNPATQTPGDAHKPVLNVQAGEKTPPIVQPLKTPITAEKKQADAMVSEGGKAAPTKAV